MLARAAARCLLSYRASPAEQNHLFGFSPVGNPSSVPSLDFPEQAGTETCSRCTGLGAKYVCGSTTCFQSAPGGMWRKDGLLLKMWPQGHQEHFPLELKYLASLSGYLIIPFNRKQWGAPPWTLYGFEQGHTFGKPSPQANMEHAPCIHLHSRVELGWLFSL